MHRVVIQLLTQQVFSDDWIEEVLSDNTWKEGLAYAGVPLNSKYVVSRALKYRAYVSMIGDWEHGWPLLRELADSTEEWLDEKGSGLQFNLDSLRDLKVLVIAGVDFQHGALLDHGLPFFHLHARSRGFAPIKR